MPYKDPNDPRAKAARARMQAKPEFRQKRRAYLREYYSNPTNRLRRNTNKNARNALPEAKKKQREYDQRPARKIRKLEAHRERMKDPAYRAARQEWERARLRLKNEAIAKRPRPTICEACGSDGKLRGGIAFDHCHRTGVFRGWICGHCNRILGLAGDDAERLLKLAAYLKRSRTKHRGQLTLTGV